MKRRLKLAFGIVLMVMVSILAVALASKTARRGH